MSDAPCLQRRLQVRGLVQGVGFRPYVWRLAEELKLCGWVRNTASGVEILVEGQAVQIDALTRRLAQEAPPLAELRECSWEDGPASGQHSGFSIHASDAGQVSTQIGPDTGVCPACLAELFDPADRRWRYPFGNCTHCGPRYSLTRQLPYDRAQTSLANFALCADCAREYQQPTDRRFHAEPTACPRCGPRLWLSDLKGETLNCADPLAETLKRLLAGEIIAIKGLGGFHLAGDARNPQAVERLRQRKQRDEKPLALMAANPASVAELTDASPAEIALLQAPERPIVLLRKTPKAALELANIAPGLAWLGVMLPYTPLHWLLFHEAAGRPVGSDWLAHAQQLLLVMTSANPSAEPLVTGNDEALSRLQGIADAILMHDREIVVPCDDSLLRLKRQAPQFIRRARGYTPRAICLAQAGPAVLSLGGDLKNTICITRGDEAFVSQHIGDLHNPASCRLFQEVIEHLLDILQVTPEVLAHDLHPDFFASRHALELAERWGVPAIAVQHHHAHIAAVAAEHAVHGPLLGLAMDGIGLGSDGSAWGGELLRVEAATFRRLGHLCPLPLPGADQAAKEPWRMAAATLYKLGRGQEIPQRFSSQPLARQLHSLLEQQHWPSSSSLGRYFDAAAGLLGIRQVMAYEGQAAMLLEGLAESVEDMPAMHKGYRLQADGQLDLLPLLARLADERDTRQGAALFHSTLAEALADWVCQAAEQQGLDTLALGGGCFLNQILSHKLCERLGSRGLRVLEAQQIPPNDGGLSLGQAWVAQAAIRQR